jgi:hypothetical protein
MDLVVGLPTDKSVGWSISIKYVADALRRMNSGLFGFWHRFGSVTGFFKPAPSPKSRQKPKILAAHRSSFLSMLYCLPPLRGFGGEL